jgi:iron-sulfur cluster assembly protein
LSFLYSICILIIKINGQLVSLACQHWDDDNTKKEENIVITITEQAADKIKEMLTEQEEEGKKLYLRVGVKDGGCSGLSYGMGFDGNVEAQDVKFEQQGIDVIVDSENAPMLEGVKIDFKENMMGGGFTIDNPNAVASCGCGSSFRTADNKGTPEDC